MYRHINMQEVMMRRPKPSEGCKASGTREESGRAPFPSAFIFGPKADLNFVMVEASECQEIK